MNIFKRMSRTLAEAGPTLYFTGAKDRHHAHVSFLRLNYKTAVEWAVRDT
jgi:hypothetical protein